MTGKGRSRSLFVFAAALALAAAVAVVAASRQGERHSSFTRFDPRKEARFELGEGLEAQRRGPENPAVEQVEDRAYPRTYVDDRLAQKAREAFERKPQQLGASSFSTPSSFATALAASPGAWSALGPVTPNVAGEASQFLDPVTLKGPTTQESGRVTALAIDPNCGKASAPAGAPCRLWVAAAGGGIWRTNNALAGQPSWIAPPDDLPTNAFGSLIIDPNDPTGNTLYAGSGEPNGSGDSEAGLGLFKSTNGGVSWQLVAGSQPVALNRSIGAVAVKPGAPNTIYIGTDVARHGSSAANGGRRTPPGAPALGFYSSTDGGAHFTFSAQLQAKTPANPTPPGAGTGSDWFQGGITKLALDPNNLNTVYAAVFGYGLWRSADGGLNWTQVFHTLNQTAFGTKAPGDTFGDRVEFEAVNLGGGKTRIYLGDSSDDLGRSQVWRTDDAAAIVGDPNGAYANAGWTELSSPTNGTNGFLAFNYCQTQCGYDDFVTSPAAQLGVGPGFVSTLWLGGSMNYDELPAYNGAPPRSNGRAVIRSTNGGAVAADVSWQDMSATVGSAPSFSFTQGIHPDQHAVVFDPVDPNIAFVGSDGGVVRIDVRSPQDKSAACAPRRFVYTPGQGAVPLGPADLLDCQRLLSGIPQTITPINDGLNTIQFQSVSFNPKNPTGELLGGTQDNGTFAYTGSPTWLESVGGDGGQSGFDPVTPKTRYHNYFDATPEVNFHGNDPTEWLDIYDPLQTTGELRSFYVPFIADPRVGGRAFIGLEHVWRTDSNGGDPAYLEAHCNALRLDPNRKACGDWKTMGANLTGSVFGNFRVGQFVVATERAPSDNGTLWAGTRTGRVFVTSNADDSQPRNVRWTRLDTPSTPGRFVSGIAVDPNDPNHAWISYSGYDAYTPDTPGHVFEARYNPVSGTASFTDRSYDLGDQPITGIAEFGPTGDLYAASDFGVLRLPSGASHWENAGTGLPSVAVYGLTLSQSGKVLYAATHGRGAYALSLPTP
jgi:hypothetical protein